MKRRKAFHLLFCAVATISLRCDGAADLARSALEKDDSLELSTSEHLSIAEELSRQAYYDSALVHFQNALTDLYRRESWDSVVVALTGAGEALIASGKLEAARDSNSVAREIGKDSCSSATKDKTRLLYARILLEEGDHLTAVDSLLAIVRDSKDNRLTRLSAICHIGWAERELGNYHSARSRLEQALESLNCESTAQCLTRAFCLNQAGLTAWSLARYDRSEAFFRNAIHIRSRLLGFDHPYVSSVASNLGMVLYTQGRYGEAIRLFEQDLSRQSERFGTESEGVARAYSNIGLVYWKIGKPTRAIEFLTKSRDIRRLLSEAHPKLHTVYNRLGLAYLDAGDYQTSISYHKLSLIGKRSKGQSHPELAHAYNNIGIALLAMGEPDSARQYHERALHIRSGSVRDHSDHAYSYHNLANTYEAEGLTNKAFLLHQQGLRINRRGDDHKGSHLSYSYVQLARNALLRREYQAGIAYADSAISVSDASAGFEFDIQFLPTHSVDALYIKGVALEQGETTDTRVAALHAYEEALRLLSALRITFWDFSAKMNLMKQQADIIRSAFSNSLNLYYRTNQTFYLDSALRFADSMRQTYLSDLILVSTWLSSDTASARILRREKSLRSEIFSLSSQLDGESTKGDSLLSNSHQGPLRDKLFNLRRQYYDLQSEVKSHYLRYFDKKQAVRIESVELRPKDAVISFVSGTDSIHVFIVTDKESVVHSVPSRTCYRLLREYLQGIDSRERGLFDKSASGLYNLLLKPVEEILDVEHLIIIPDGELYRLPFEALLTHDPSSKATAGESTEEIPYLIRKYSVSYAYSATLRELAGDRPSPRPDREFLGVAPVFSPPSGTLSPRFRVVALPGSEREIRALGRLFDPWYRLFSRGNSQLLIGTKATEEALLDHEIDRFRYIHFATHGFADEHQPERSGLALYPSSNSQDGLLHLGEVYSYSLSADLVVLGACDTGRGGFVDGEGVVGLAGGFLYAGAKNVVVSLWQVDDDASLTLMKPFYRYTLRMEPVAEALRKAKLSMINSRTKYSRPYYWASYVLFS